MGDFFKGWRRKVGVAVLCVVVVLSGLWLRTRFYTDRVRFAVEQRVHEIASRLDGLMWTSVNGHNGQTNHLTWETIKPGPRERLGAYLEAWTENLRDNSPRYWFVVYWWLAWPLILISLHLILWKPRKRVVRFVNSDQPNL